ncbi:hypothetical protein CVV68_11130 [Arthrobacter livingstonensis]|uniref:Uncharacterized protein n=1 Tax=Arthrobacter livingstonensis TaxID=670078 RepID=A0A2V5L6U1_9MICC|nr:metallophosphoesterase [Arthrobacter livingstonensis]PYI67281.1 hypothetical protein CVV68_11130 [Arthrobacter livingstonensis]
MKAERLARHEVELGFRPRPAVRWLSPPELLRSGIRVLIAQMFAAYDDRREIQSVFAQATINIDRYKHRDGHLWIDFVADLGDGFDATFTIASLLAQESLTVLMPDGGTAALPKAHLVVMGGDEVYPTASSKAYEDRTSGPYGAASRPTPNAALLALPGNHDWYDGLTAFMRMFAQGAAVGGWQTLQTRSYFAVQLQAGWWLVALDSQLGEYIDQPQLDYFEQAISTKLRPGDAIILCAASPTWETTAHDPNAFNTLNFFENGYLLNKRNHLTGQLEPTGAAVRLWISGDHHHYARYSEQAPDPAGRAPDPRNTQMVACGLGGAYLMGTDRLAPELALPPDGSRMRTKSPLPTNFFRAAAAFPDQAISKTLYLRLLNPFSRYWLPTRNPWFGVALGVVHMVLFTVLAAMLAATSRLTVTEAVRTGTVPEALAMSGWAFGVPLAVVSVYRLFVALTEGRTPPSGWQPLAAVAVQLVVSAGLFVLAVSVPGIAGLPVGLVLLIAATAGAVLGAEAFALFVVLAPPGNIGDFKMTGLAYEDGKGFVRMHLTPDGELTLYPLLVDTVVHDWDIQQEPDGTARPRPHSALPHMRLLEPPIAIARSGLPREGRI